MGEVEWFFVWYRFIVGDSCFVRVVWYFDYIFMSLSEGNVGSK